MCQSTVASITYLIFMKQISLSDSGLGELSHSNGPNYHYICSLPLSAHGWWDMEKHVTQELGQITSFETLEFVSRSPESCIRDLLWFI